MSTDYDAGNPYLKPGFIAEAMLIYALFGVLKLIGLPLSSAIGGFLGRTIGPRIGRSKTARNNLMLAMPELSEAQREHIVVEMWDNLGRTIFEYPHLATYHRDFASGTQKLLRVEDKDNAYSLIPADRPAIFISGHFANWEVLPMCLIPWWDRVGEVVRPANNPYVDRLIGNLRRTYVAPNQIEKGPSGTRALLRLMAKNGLAALLVDQKDNKGVEVNFFGHPAHSPVGAAGLALRYDCAVIPVLISREGRSHRFSVRVLELVPLPAKDDPDALVTLVQSCNDAIEQMVRINPTQWMWLHNRFRKPYIKDKWKDFVDEEGKPIR